MPKGKQRKETNLSDLVDAGFIEPLDNAVRQRIPRATASKCEWIASVDLPPQHIGVLQGIFTASWHGLQRDLQHARGPSNREEALREASVFVRLLTGLERGEVSGPDEVACKTIRELMITADVANDHARAVTEHDALQGLLNLLRSSEIRKQ